MFNTQPEIIIKLLNIEKTYTNELIPCILLLLFSNSLLKIIVSIKFRLFDFELLEVAARIFMFRVSIRLCISY